MSQIHGRDVQCVTVLVVYAVGPVPTRQEIVETGREVVSVWFKFGVALGVPISKLRDIEFHSMYSKEEFRMIAMVDHWLRTTPGACWQQVAAALEEIDLIDLASHVKQEYLPEGVCVCVCVCVCVFVCKCVHVHVHTMCNMCNMCCTMCKCCKRVDACTMYVAVY